MELLKHFSVVSAKSTMLAGVAASALFLTTVDLAVAQGQGQGQGGSSESAGGGSDSGQGGGGSDAGQGARGSDSGQGGGGSDAGQGARGSDSGQGGAGGRNAVSPDAEDGEGGSGQAGEGGGRPEGTGGRPDDVGGGDEDSDRPDWAGTPGGSAGRGTPPDAGGGGDLYGDLYVILRDEDGVPILSDAGFVQPVAADGSLIPLDEEGHVIDESLVQEVEIGRLNVSRAPEDVLDGRSEEVVSLLNAATDVSFDPAGRLVLTIDGETTTIDSPLENLSIYVALMTTGTIEEVDNPALGDLFLVDGVKDADDLSAAATFLAAATDKAGELTTDEIAYVNLILDIAPTTIGDTEVTYSDVDFSDFTYDRASTYQDVTTTVLVPQEDGSWVPTEINIYEAVFDSENDTAVDGTMEAFTTASDDARTVINFIHEYELPVLPEDL